MRKIGSDIDANALQASGKSVSIKNFIYERIIALEPLVHLIKTPVFLVEIGGMIHN